jgi:2-polyprenyl-6-methoxyphenol hydroxylase-like FAD-dependent oxidoreductase
MMETMRSVGSVDGDGDEGGTVSAGQVLRVVFGARIQSIEESGEADGEGSVRIRFTRHSNHTPDQVTGDILLGCDGIHSQVRRTLVDPERSKSYSGKCVANGYAKVSRSQVAGWARGDGHQLLRDTTMVSRGGHSLLISHYQPDDEHVYVAAVLPRPEPAADSDGSTRTGWATATADRASLKADIADTFAGGPLRQSLKELVDMCEEWNFFPVYMLPPGGMWVQGRVLLLGDAAHAVGLP